MPNYAVPEPARGVEGSNACVIDMQVCKAYSPRRTSLGAYSAWRKDPAAYTYASSRARPCTRFYHGGGEPNEGCQRKG